MPNSSMFPLPTITAPAEESLSTTPASYVGTYSSNIRDAQVVATPRVLIRSLIWTGIPVNGLPFPLEMSSRWTSSRARSAVTVTNVCTLSSISSMRARQALTTSDALISPRAINAWASWIVEL